MNLGYTFKNTELLERALTHSSYSDTDYERLEFLGDSVLSLAITKMLFDHYPDAEEGQLTEIRSRMVSEQFLSELSIKMGLYRYIKVDRGAEQDQVPTSRSVLADVFEAIVGAVYLDSSYEEVFEFIAGIFKPWVENPPVSRNWKGELQQLTQKKWKAQPKYSCVNSYGPESKKVFVVHVYVNNWFLGVGEGFSKKEAETAAAKTALTAQILFD